MFPRERYLSERIADLTWRIPRLITSSKKHRFERWITRKEGQKLSGLEAEVLQKLQNLASDQSTMEVAGSIGTMMGFLQYYLVKTVRSIDVS